MRTVKIYTNNSGWNKRYSIFIRFYSKKFSENGRNGKFSPTKDDKTASKLILNIKEAQHQIYLVDCMSSWAL